MFSTVKAAAVLLRRALVALEPRTFRGDDAARLLRAFAEVERLAALRQRAQRVKASAAENEAARHRAVQASRYLRHWNEADGAFCLKLRTTTEAGARFLANVKPFCDQAFADARRAGRRESSEAYAADALVSMSDAAIPPGTEATTSSGPRAIIHVSVDHAALLRGHTEAGEMCEVPGVGPISVATARAWAGDAVLRALVTKGVDVVAVAHAGRSVTVAQRVAIEERDRCCVVEGCGATRALEIDHVDGWALTRTTTLRRLARLCRWHHYLKTHCGHRLEGGVGNWQLVPPDHPPDDDVGPGPPDASSRWVNRGSDVEAAWARPTRGPVHIRMT